MRRLLKLVAVLVVLGTGAGCGYALAGRGNALPATIKTIGVPLFVNRSTTPEIDRSLTSAVLQEFQSRGRYQVKSEAAGVDAVLTGTIVNVLLPPVAFSRENQATRILIIVTASLEFKEVSTGRVIWANPSFQVRDEYDVTTGTSATDPTALFRQDQNALDRLSRSFARSVVASIFEAF
ncbi:MAG: LPS assembly lipoprotein LptE [Vicinamibacterales bacterium]